MTGTASLSLTTANKHKRKSRFLFFFPLTASLTHCVCLFSSFFLVELERCVQNHDLLADLFIRHVSRFFFLATFEVAPHYLTSCRSVFRSLDADHTTKTSWIVCVCVGAAGAPPAHVRGLLSEQAEVGVHRHRVRELLRGKPPSRRRDQASKRWLERA